jgi:3-hydroxyisobutyrate dehydrogenase-like beta-hydroxyacid dehydrogenase
VRDVLTVGVLHPGEMGAALAAALAAGGHRVVWCSAGRGPATRARAERAGLSDVGDLAGLTGVADVVVAVCPPHAAVELAAAVAGRGFAGVYVDANAVSPATSDRIQEVVGAAGARYVDGGIVGPPPLSTGTTRLYLAGPAAPDVAALFAGSVLEARVLPGRPGAASALKLAYAAWTKGSAALLLTARRLAVAAGVDDALVAEWALSLPELETSWARADASARAKGWRWSGEMQEIAAAMAAAGLPDGFHTAAADVFARYPRPDGVG